MSSPDRPKIDHSLVPYLNLDTTPKGESVPKEAVEWIRLFVQDEWTHPLIRQFGFNNEYPLDNLIAIFNQQSKAVNKDRISKITDILFQEQVSLLVGNSSIPSTDTQGRQDDITTLGNILLLASYFGAGEESRIKMYELYQSHAIEGAAMHRIQPGEHPRYGLNIQDQLLGVVALYGPIPGLDEEQSKQFYQKAMVDNPSAGFLGLLKTSTNSAFESLGEFITLLEQNEIYVTLALWNIMMNLEELNKGSELALFLKNDPDLATRIIEPLKELGHMDEDYPTVFNYLKSEGLI
jgi:hypothetical protein